MANLAASVPAAGEGLQRHGSFREVGTKSPQLRVEHRLHGVTLDRREPEPPPKLTGVRSSLCQDGEPLEEEMLELVQLERVQPADGP